jgi:hypothetical protein
MASRQLQAQKEALTFAQLTPQGRVAMGGYMAGRQLGGALGGLLGAEDPELARIRQRQSLVQGLDLNSSEALRAAASRALQAGDTSAASMLASRAMQVEKSQAELEATQALTAQRMRERVAADPLQQLIRAGKYTPQSVELYNKTQNISDLVLVDKDTEDPINKLIQNGKYTPASVAKYQKSKDIKDLELVEKPSAQWDIREVGVAEVTREPVYTLREPGKAPRQVVYRRDPATGEQVVVPYTGGVDRTTAKVTASASSKAQDAGAVKAAELDARTVDEARTLGYKAVEQAGVLRELLATPQPISGAGANIRVGALRVFNTLGLTSPTDQKALESADKFTALAGERVLSFIKTLGTNPTDTDREFARTIGPALEKGTKSNADLINYLLKRAKDVSDNATAMEEHFYNNNYSLKGFKSPLLRNLNPVPTPSGRSPEDLARIAGGRIVNGVFVKDAK